MGSSCRLVSSSLVDVKVSKGSNVLLREVTEPRAERMLEWGATRCAPLVDGSVA